MGQLSFERKSKTSKIFLALIVFWACELGSAPAWAGDPIRLAVSDKEVDSFFDLPFGVHQIPKTNVIFARTAKSANAKEMEKVLGLDINGITRKILLDQFVGKDTAGGFTISDKADGDLLDIKPWIWLNVLKNGEVVPWTVWEVEYWDIYWGKRKWEGFCVACLSRSLPLEGKDSWTDKSGELFEQAVKTDARKLFEMLKTDLSGGYKNKHFQKKTIEAAWMSGEKPEAISVNFIETDPETLLLKNLGDKAFSDFLAGGLTGLFLKSVISNSVLFNGALVLSKDYGETLEDTPTPTPTESKKKGTW